MDQSERFHQQLRDLAPEIYDARVEVLKSEVNLKKVFWQELVKAKDAGERSYNAQKARAEASDEYGKASMEVAVAKATLDSKNTLKAAADMEFEEWRTKMANLRMERSRYNA
tara:strand:- start:280 stop:615 length:336 start_codon:yes stop_codon:yes gene_type:complete